MPIALQKDPKITTPQLSKLHPSFKTIIILRVIKKIFLLILVLVIFNSSMNLANAASGFVTRNGKELFVNDKPFKFIGVNRYNLLTVAGPPYLGCGTALTDEEIVTIFSELKVMGVKAVRFWIFQSFTKSGTDFTRFNLVLTQAAVNDIKVIPVFENQWGDCTQGAYKYNDWYKDGYKSPYGTYPINLKDYISRVVPIYKDNPAILMWQIMNEAESQIKGPVYQTDGQSLFDFTNDIAPFIKSLDPNHLVSLGTMGGGQPGTGGPAFRSLHAISALDILEYHDYGDEQILTPQGLNDRFNDSQVLNKPVMVGEAGIVIQPGCSGGTTNSGNFRCFSKNERASLFKNKIDNFFSKPEGVGYLIWSYRDRAITNNQGFDFGSDDPLAAYITGKSSQLITQTPVTRKIGDTDNDGDVDIFDYNAVLSDLGKTQPGLPSDVDQSGKVDIFDFNIVLTNFGK